MLIETVKNSFYDESKKKKKKKIPLAKHTFDFIILILLNILYNRDMVLIIIIEAIFTNFIKKIMRFMCYPDADKSIHIIFCFLNQVSLIFHAVRPHSRILFYLMEEYNINKTPTYKQISRRGLKQTNPTSYFYNMSKNVHVYLGIINCFLFDFTLPLFSLLIIFFFFTLSAVLLNLIFFIKCLLSLFKPLS